MIYPKVWGQGALFCYSGIDGENSYQKSIAGTLSGDKLGIIFHKMQKVELYLGLQGVKDVCYDIVSGDLILADIKNNLGAVNKCGFVFYSEDVIKGLGTSYAVPFLSGYLLPVRYQEGSSYIYDELSGMYCVLVIEKREDLYDFALAFSSLSLSDARNKAKFAAAASFDEEADKKLTFYHSLPNVDGIASSVEMALSKSFSLMKTQVYTAGGRFNGMWTTPDRLPHRRCWLWDSVFHALGNRYISMKLAQESVQAIFDFQHQNGFIPHTADDSMVESKVTQPPIIAWGLHQLYLGGADLQVLCDNYDKLKNYLQWNIENRDCNGNLLFEWTTNQGCPTNQCDECGMDNSPRFDGYETMDCIDFSCYMASEARSMKDIAEVIGCPDEAMEWDKLYNKICSAVNEYLWDEEDGFYYDRVVSTGEFKKVKSVASFITLFAGVCDERRARTMADKLNDPALFGTSFSVPTISKDDPVYGTDMWRGPVWTNFNYFILKGLSEYGFENLHDRLLNKTIEVIVKWYMQEGVMFEFYDSECKNSPKRLQRKGYPVEPYNFDIRMQTIRDYGWTGALFADMVIEKQRRDLRKADNYEKNITR